MFMHANAHTNTPLEINFVHAGNKDLVLTYILQLSINQSFISSMRLHSNIGFISLLIYISYT